MNQHIINVIWPILWSSGAHPDLCVLYVFRDDDDINDVASMAGVNLNEENARIMATNSELVGTKIRSCKDEAFLPPGLLHRRIMEAGRSYQMRGTCSPSWIWKEMTGVRHKLLKVVELGPDVCWSSINDWPHLAIPPQIMALIGCPNIVCL